MTSGLAVTSGLRPVPAELVRLFLTGTEFRLVAHVRGDADSASIFALAAGLRKLGKRIICNHDLPEHLAWLVPHLVSDEGVADPLVVAVDTGNFSRLALSRAQRDEIARLLKTVTTEADIDREQWWGVCRVDAVIDHHVSNNGYGLFNWIDAQASSSAELVTSLLVALEDATGVSLFDADICWRLYTGLASDTQWFVRPVPASAYLCAAYLESRFDIDKNRIAEALRAQSEGYFRLGEAIRRTFRLKQGVATAFIDSASLRQHAVSAEEAATMIEDLERLPAGISLLFVETRPGEIRVRLRGKDVPIIDLAKRFGGGGHTYRAGAVVGTQNDMEALVDAAGQWLAAQAETSRSG